MSDLSIWLHHLSLHAPLVLPPALAIVGFATAREETPRLIALLRYGGWATLALTTLAAIAGILSAPGVFGGGGEEVLRDHRDLGVTAWCVAAAAAAVYDYGARHDARDTRRLGLCLWAVTSLATIGAGHWGGLYEHAELIPF